MQNALQDIRYGLRVLGTNPGFTTAAVLILALGIGANTTIFCVVNALLFSPLPYKDADRIAYVLAGKERIQNWGAVSAADYEDWKNQNQVFDQIALYSPDAVNLAGGGEPERVGAIRVSAEMMPLLGIKPMIGRTFTSEEFTSGRNHSVLLSEGLWKRRFGSNPSALGGTLMVDGLPYTVAGVLPARLKLALIAGFEPEAMLPLLLNSSETRATRNLGAIGLLKPGVTLERARLDMAVIAQRLQQQYPETNAGWTVFVDTLRGTVDPAAYILLVVLICAVLGLACTNVTNLLLARAAGRQREISIRSALGATRSRILRQLLTESLMLSFLGCCLGIMVSFWACAIIRSFTSGSNAGVLDIRIDQNVLIGSLVLFAISGIAVGLLPALQAARTDLNQPLKECASNTPAAPSKRRIRNALVVSEIAISLLLLTGAGLVIKSWFRMWQIDLGFQPQRVLTMGITLSKSEYPRDHQRVAFFEQLLSRLKDRSDVQSAAVTSALPTSGAVNSFTVEGRPQPVGGEEPAARFAAVCAQYFVTLAIPVRAGRSFAETDTVTALPVAIINEAMARKYWAAQDPMGSQIEVAGRLRTIVGVVGDVKSVPLSVRPYPEIYVPYTQSPSAQMSLVIRTALRDPLNAATMVKKEIQAINPNQPTSGIRTMVEAMSSNMGVIKLGTSLLTILAVGALILAAAGIGGVLSYAVSQRTAEIGIRMAVGASRGKVLKMVLRQGLALVTIGLLLGLAGSVLLGRILSNRVYGVNPTEPVILAGVVCLLLGVSLGACYIPARRATRIDPIQALRSE
jgi:putative ABC transport system permease protein